MVLITLNNSVVLNYDNPPNISDVKTEIQRRFNLPHDEFYLLKNGKIASDIQSGGCLEVVPRLLGGKGGFGSMLRAIGAQIEKTTNREACRDLSGRRLRDINEEKRLKTWIAQQAEREKEADDRRQKKLQRLMQKPKHEFRDAEYDKDRDELPEKIESALDEGLKASCSGTKRKQDDEKKVTKKARLWMDDELGSSGVSDSDDEGAAADDKKSDDSNSGENTSSTDKKTDTIIDKNYEEDINKSD